MATQLIASGSTAASSSDVTVTAGAPITVSIKGATNMEARVVIELKDDASTYNTVGQLTASQPSAVLAGPGVYRLTRIAGGTCGVFSG